MTIRFPILLNTADNSIEDLELSTRSYHACRRAGVVTIGDLVAAIESPKGIERWYNVGKFAVREIKSKLFNYQLENAPDPDSYAKRVIELNMENLASIKFTTPWIAVEGKDEVIA